ncbi:MULTISPECIES: hydantoinase/oxoprolinase family protein [unclassified Sphingomonas]|uniref:hydantoinase/oxoprolinase family protein n=1 Tax=unclassified Sphingomonas TaxID=196159 RepID=UPI0006F76000|nr:MULTISPECIES: hydantoinase/oxoprolinase family protein [unclassified Sphingomonas]KQX19969.1 5-oxoprolinase [Sphingomonas sp. Root1294]KQY67216.1 5-oxoprolinase [Sphingomonas sp. Root50]KRB90590.1 5-oxoprolinase [Sphingomonas sp. Root720]
MYRIGFDVGGTFTDFTMLDEGSGAVHYFKVPSTPHDPSEAIGTGLSALIADHGIDPALVRHLGHGTTVATNMVIERKGALTGLITTRGFRDTLEIGRQTRPHLYDYSIGRPTPLVPRELRIEVAERILSDGTVEVPLDEEQVAEAARALGAAGVGAVVICFLHSYRRPEHERRAGEIVRAILPDAYVSLSSNVLPEFREFERMSTTVLNAYMGPRMGTYLERLLGRVGDLGITGELNTVHSNGGLMSVPTVREIPVRTCVSGPAAGVIGAAEIGRFANFPNLVTFDVGGTSTDVSVIVAGKPLFASDRLVADYPVKTPMIDIHVIGAGGGSIAAIDDAGALKVGPRSAGAAPGPVAYARGGTEPTITDANIVLGRLDPVALLEGRLPVDAEAARQAIEERIARPLGLSVEEAAHGILRIANANMSRAIRSVSTERGHDIRDFALFAYGGAGPLHACDLAQDCGIRTVLVPQEPGTLCARGILLSDINMDFVRSELSLAGDLSWRRVCAVLGEMRDEATAWLVREGVAAEDQLLRIMVDARYDGQNFEVSVPLDDVRADGLDDMVQRFRRQHVQEYGYDVSDRPVEIVNCRVQAVGRVARVPVSAPVAVPGLEPVKGRRPVYFGKETGWVETSIYRRGQLPIGRTFAGPAIIEEMSSTLIVQPGQTVTVDPVGNLIVSIFE